MCDSRWGDLLQVIDALQASGCFGIQSSKAHLVTGYVADLVTRQHYHCAESPVQVNEPFNPSISRITGLLRMDCVLANAWLLDSDKKAGYVR
ncbi:MAG: hypothetical protein AB8B64_03820 [Granulosicoccus sp.]